MGWEIFFFLKGRGGNASLKGGWSAGVSSSEPVFATATTPLPPPKQRTRFFSGGAWHDAAVYVRDQLAPGHRVAGPAIVIEPHQTIVVEDGWRAEVTTKNHLVLTRVTPLSRGHAVGTAADPVMLEGFNNLFMSIAEQMALSFQNPPYPSNIKTRPPFSSPVFP